MQQFEVSLNKILEYGYSFIVFLSALVVVSSILYIFFGTWKKILFKTWINRYDNQNTDLGTSVADLLLFNLKQIKSTHDRSMSKSDLWNPYDDVPLFRRGLDPDIQLIASVELGNYGKFISGLLKFLFTLIPLIFKPAEMNGSINKFDNKVIFLVTLDNYKIKRKNINFDSEKTNAFSRISNWFKSIFKKSKKNNILWKIEKKTDDKTNIDIPEIIEEIANKMYIDLT